MAPKKQLERLSQRLVHFADHTGGQSSGQCFGGWVFLEWGEGLWCCLVMSTSTAVVTSGQLPPTPFHPAPVLTLTTTLLGHLSCSLWVSTSHICSPPAPFIILKRCPFRHVNFSLADTLPRGPSLIEGPHFSAKFALLKPLTRLMPPGQIFRSMKRKQPWHRLGSGESLISWKVSTGNPLISASFEAEMKRRSVPDYEPGLIKHY